MSKDKPEVGDVWKVSGEIGGGYYKAFKVVVINTINFIHPYCLSEDNEPFFMCECEAEFKYLGKSKVKIEDLFKTENEK